MLLLLKSHLISSFLPWYKALRSGCGAFCTLNGYLGGLPGSPCSHSPHVPSQAVWEGLKALLTLTHAPHTQVTSVGHIPGVDLISLGFCICFQSGWTPVCTAAEHEGSHVLLALDPLLLAWLICWGRGESEE